MIFQISSVNSYSRLEKVRIICGFKLASSVIRFSGSQERFWSQELSRPRAETKFAAISPVYSQLFSGQGHVFAPRGGTAPLFLRFVEQQHQPQAAEKHQQKDGGEKREILHFGVLHSSYLGNRS